jgi:hypothetical protein
VVKQTGKKDMYRSKPARKKQVQETEDKRDDEAEDVKRFFT